MSEDALRKSLEGCNVCNVALVEEIKERTARGERIEPICKDLEDYQRQVMGEVYYSHQALRKRYERAMGASWAEDKRPPHHKRENIRPDSFGEVMKALTRVNTIINQRAHGFDESNIEAIKQQLGLIFRNLGG
jgi:hypothetical protein